MPKSCMRFNPWYIYQGNTVFSIIHSLFTSVGSWSKLPWSDHGLFENDHGLGIFGQNDHGQNTMVKKTF